MAVEMAVMMDSTKVEQTVDQMVAQMVETKERLKVILREMRMVELWGNL